MLLLLPSSLLRTLIPPLPPHLLDRVINLLCSPNKMSSMSRHYKSPKSALNLKTNKQTMWVFIVLFLFPTCVTVVAAYCWKNHASFSLQEGRNPQPFGIMQNPFTYLGEGSNYWYPLSTSLPPTPRTTVPELKIPRKPLCNSRIARVGGGSWVIHW